MKPIKFGKPRSLVKKPPEESSPELTPCSTATGAAVTGSLSFESTISCIGAVFEEGEDGNLLGSWARRSDMVLRLTTIAAMLRRSEEPIFPSLGQVLMAGLGMRIPY